MSEEITRERMMEHARLIADQISFGGYEPNVLFLTDYLMGMQWVSPGNAAEKFAAWVNAGPKLASNAGLYVVGIKVEPAKVSNNPPKPLKS